MDETTTEVSVKIEKTPAPLAQETITSSARVSTDACILTVRINVGLGSQARS